MSNPMYDQIQSARKNRTLPGPAGGAGPSWLQPLLAGGAQPNYGPGSINQRTGQSMQARTGWDNAAADQAVAAGAAKDNQRWLDAYNRGAPGVQGFRGKPVQTGPNRNMTRFDAGEQAAINSAGNISNYLATGGAGGGYGGGAGGGRAGAGGSLAKSAQDYLDQANAKNEERYQQLLGLTGQLSDSALKRDEQMTRDQLGHASQSLASRGLGNSTIVDSVHGAINDQAGIRRAEIGDQGIRAAMGVVERRSDVGPDLGLMAQIASQPGAVGGGGGYGYGPGVAGGAILGGRSFNAQAVAGRVAPANYGPASTPPVGGPDRAALQSRQQAQQQAQYNLELQRQQALREQAANQAAMQKYMPPSLNTGDASANAWGPYNQFDPNQVY